MLIDGLAAQRARGSDGDGSRFVERRFHVVEVEGVVALASGARRQRRRQRHQFGDGEDAAGEDGGRDAPIPEVDVEDRREELGDCRLGGGGQHGGPGHRFGRFLIGFDEGEQRIGCRSGWLLSGGQQQLQQQFAEQCVLLTLGVDCICNSVRYDHSVGIYDVISKKKDQN